MGKNKFPAEFVWSYENFCKFYGKQIIEKETTPVAMATPEQLQRVAKLIDIVKVDDATVNKWFLKADVDSFDEMSDEQIQKVIEFLEKKVAPLLEKEEEKMNTEVKTKKEKK